ncbi:hypothetical protein MPNT_20085 [Candidatus Methylacidithermus pantelleriae]|uniref:Uncharacterized protein n=1 Tax=Candidatus Methylacidithermus pantelleriae TaxID=2744239 RepID=A0A8J2BPA5_9BACT|nr:hypothetical protein MPNT_20085 [Candidatus Methylacidithermus pantelleriae]
MFPVRQERAPIKVWLDHKGNHSSPSRLGIDSSSAWTGFAYTNHCRHFVVNESLLLPFQANC